MRPAPLAAALIMMLACDAGAAQDQEQPVAGKVLRPVDEGKRNSSFAVFRKALANAAKAGDLARVMADVSPNPKYNEDLAVGNLDQFRKEWELDTNPRDFMSLLLDVLEHGGRFNTAGEFVAPYVYTEFPGSDMDMATHVVVVRASAPVFAETSEDSRRIASVSYVILKSSGGVGWCSVTLPDGRRGSMRAADVRAPSGARAVFRKIDGKWKLIVFAAGID